MEVIGSGETKTSVRFFDGLAADLRVVPEEEFPAALLYFTGSKEHNTALRGARQADGPPAQRVRPFRRRRAASGCPRRPRRPSTSGWASRAIEPELREGAGEIEAAESGSLPRLVDRRRPAGRPPRPHDASDGRDSLEDMARAARDAGYAYVAFTDHSKTAGYAGGLTEERVLAQRDEIRALRRRMPELRIFHGTEADILADGSIDYGDDVPGPARPRGGVGALPLRFVLARSRPPG